MISKMHNFFFISNIIYVALKVWVSKPTVNYSNKKRKTHELPACLINVELSIARI